MQTRFDLQPRWAVIGWKRKALLSLVLAIVLAVWIYTSRSTTPAEVYDLYQGAALVGAAPDFQLVDQKGERVALSALRGRVVVLTFLDSQCQDVCPLTALHLRTAYQTLGADAPVTLIGVNVNLQANRVADVRVTSQRWRLDEIPVWHFLTGSKEELEPVWQAYHIGMQMTAEGHLMHGTGVYLLDQRGQQRWHVSVPFDETGASPDFTPLSDLLVLHIRELLHEG